MVAPISGTVSRGRPKNHKLRKDYLVTVGTELVKVSQVFHDPHAGESVIGGHKVSPRGNVREYVAFPQKMVDRNYHKNIDDALRYLKDVRKEAKKQAKN